MKDVSKLVELIKPLADAAYSYEEMRVTMNRERNYEIFKSASDIVEDAVKEIVQWER